jgi:hypothetical protein
LIPRTVPAPIFLREGTLMFDPINPSNSRSDVR